VKTALDEADIKIPYPQRELLGREEAGGFQLTGNDAAEIGGAEQFEQSHRQS